MRLDEHVVLGKSVLSNIGQRRERLMAEVFEAVRQVLPPYVLLQWHERSMHHESQLV